MQMINIKNKEQFMAELVNLFDTIVKDKTSSEDIKHAALAAAAAVAMGIASDWLMEIHRKFAYYTLMIQEVDRRLN